MVNVSIARTKRTFTMAENTSSSPKVEELEDDVEKELQEPEVENSGSLMAGENTPFEDSGNSHEVTETVSDEPEVDLKKNNYNGSCVKVTKYVK